MWWRTTPESAGAAALRLDRHLRQGRSLQGDLSLLRGLKKTDTGGLLVALAPVTFLQLLKAIWPVKFR
jgi:hypothetical protein